MSVSLIFYIVGVEILKEMIEEDILYVIEDYRVVVRNVIVVGFDGVEVYGGNGYLFD